MELPVGRVTLALDPHGPASEKLLTSPSRTVSAVEGAGVVAVPDTVQLLVPEAKPPLASRLVA